SRLSHSRNRRIPFSLLSDATTVDGSNDGTNLILPNGDVVPSPKALANLITKKARMKAGADQFNEKPKTGVEYLVRIGVLPEPATPQSVAHFLRTNPFVNKTVI